MRMRAIGFSMCLALTSVSLSAQGQGDWKKVQRWPRGEVFAVADDAGAIITGRVLRVDADSILLYAPRVSSKELKPIEQLIRHDARLLEDVDHVPTLLEKDELLIGVTGISKKGRPIAAFNDVFSVVAREHVVTVFQPQAERSSAWGTVAGVVIGGGVGGLGALGMLVSDRPCQPHCLAVPAGLFFGSATVGGLIGNTLGKPRTDLVIFRR